MPGRPKVNSRPSVTALAPSPRPVKARKTKSRCSHREGDRSVRLRLSMLTAERKRVRTSIIDSDACRVLHDQTPVLGYVCELQVVRTESIAPEMEWMSNPSATTTPIAITARTTLDSAIV